MRRALLLLLLILASCQYEVSDDLALEPILEEVVIVHSRNTDEIDPAIKTVAANTRSLNIFEALVGLDPALKIIPKLAVSWGNIDDVTWEFHLRPGVLFHDGSTFDANDVLYSFERSKKFRHSQVAGSLEQIKEIQFINDLTMRIITKEPDPTLMTKLIFVSIIPEGAVENLESDFIAKKFVGTGPYTVSSWESGGDLHLNAFPDYWGGEALARKVLIKGVPLKSDRKKLVEKGGMHLLANVPPDMLDELENSQIFRMEQQSGLDLHFLIFNINLLTDLDFRKSLYYAVNREELANLAPGLTHPAREMLPVSIFGYNPKIPKPEFNLELAKEHLKKADFSSDLVFTIDLEKQNRVIGEALQTYFRHLDLLTAPNYLEGPELIAKIFSGESQMYVLGWQFETPDGGDFLLNFFHTKEAELGQYNGSGYSNSAVDTALELANKTLKAKDRLKMLQDAIFTIHEEYVAVPLYETDRVYAVRKDLYFTPRIDGLVLAADLGKLPSSP